MKSLLTLWVIPIGLYVVVQRLVGVYGDRITPAEPHWFIRYAPGWILPVYYALVFRLRGRQDAG
jgi:hypothetical protein